MELHPIEKSFSYQQSKEITSLQRQQKKPSSDAVTDKSASEAPSAEYISSQKASEKPSGLYKVVPDEDGNPRILYDDPKKAREQKAPDGKEAAEKPAAADPDNGSEPCTTNTDRVDGEIEKLKEEKKQLIQQIKSAASDEEKVRELKKKLANVENELMQKNNDTYRRQHATVS